MSCSTFSSFLYTPQFFEFALHITSIIAIPCHILAFYCVIFKTPKNMESVKWAMLAICVWNAILDLQLTLLSAPFVMFPAIAGYPIGYLSQLGVSTPVQTVITVIVLQGSLTSLTCLFQNRYNRIRSKSGNYHQFYIYSFNMTFTLILIFVVLSDTPEQKTAIDKLFEKLSCFPSQFQSLPIFVISSNEILAGFCIGSFVFSNSLQYCFYLFITSYHFKVYRESKTSKRTRNLQKSFFFSIVLQIFIPVLIIFIPWVYAIYSCFADFYNQAFNNLLTLDCALHGTVSSSAMIMIHKPYRDVVFSARVIKVQSHYEEAAGKHKRFRGPCFFERNFTTIPI